MSLAVACAPTVDGATSDLSAEVVIAAVLQLGSGSAGREVHRVLATHRLRAGEPLVLGTAPPDIVLATWSFPRAVFVDETGAPLPDEDFTPPQLRLRAAREAPDPEITDVTMQYGRCGRCLAVARGDDPQVVHEGSSCPAPLGRVRMEVEPDAMLSEPERAAVADAVRFEWRGEECACPYEPGRPAATELAFEVAEPRTIPHAAVAALPSGAIALIDDQDVRILWPTGTSSAATMRPPQHTVMALALSEDEIVAGTLVGRTREFSLTWHQSDRRLSSWTALHSLTVDNFLPRAALAVSDPPRQFLVAGQLRELFGALPLRILVCGLDPADCVPLVQLSTTDGSESFVKLLPLEGGAHVAVSTDATVVLMDGIPTVAALVTDGARTEPTRLRVQSPTASTRDGSGGPIAGRTRWRALALEQIELRDGRLGNVAGVPKTAVAAVGNRVYMCVGFMLRGEPRTQQVILSREYRPGELESDDPLDPNLGFRVESCFDPTVASCDSMVTTATVVEAIMSGVGRRTVLRFDRDGPLDPEALRTPSCEPNTMLLPDSADRDFIAYLQVRPSSWVGVRAGGDAALIDESGKARWIYGGDARPAWSAAVADEERGAWLFGTPGVIGHILPESVAVELIAAPELRDVVVEAAIDNVVEPGQHGFILVSALGTLTRLVVDGSQVTLRPLVSPSEALASDVVEVTRGVHVAIAARRASTSTGAPQVDDQVWRIVGDTVSPMNFDRDDPTTAIDERAQPEESSLIERRCIAYRRPSDQNRIANSAAGIALRNLSASHGIAWVVGCGGELYRINALTSPGRVERHHYSRDPSLTYPTGPEGGGLRPVNMTAVGANCPDRATIAAEEPVSNAAGASLRVLELQPRGVPAAATRLELDVVVASGGPEPTLGVQDRGNAVVVVPTPAAPWLVLGSNDVRNIPGTITQFTARSSAFFGGIPEAAVRLGDGRLLVVLDGGPVVIATGGP